MVETVLEAHNLEMMRYLCVRLHFRFGRLIRGARMPCTQMAKRMRRTFNPEFKREAAQLVTDQGYTIIDPHQQFWTSS